MDHTTPCTAPGSPHSHAEASPRGNAATQPQRPLQPLRWEAVYEPANVSGCLIGHYATETLARGAGGQWFRAQRLDPDEIGTLTWDEYGQLCELYEGIETDTGIVVRRREPQAVTPVQELRAAAALLRERVTAWRAEAQTNPYWELAYATGVDNAMGGAGGRLAKLFTPEAAEGLASWLEEIADDAEKHAKGFGNSADEIATGWPLIVARVINGGDDR